MDLFQKFLDFLCPLRCAVCSVLIEKEEAVLPKLQAEWRRQFCGDCNPLEDAKNPSQHLLSGPITQTICVSCGMWGNLPRAQQHCTLCELLPLPTLRLVSIWPYSERISEAIKAFKYYKKLSLRSALSLALEEAYRRYFGQSRFDHIVAIPSSVDILRQRGFHHSALLAISLGKVLGIPSKPSLLQSSRKRSAQSRLILENRQKNIREAFVVAPRLRSWLCGKNILLLDDIITTGSTIFEATRLLQHYGASVSALTLARSPHFHKYRLRLALPANNQLTGSRRLREMMIDSVAQDVSLTQI